MSVDCSRFTFHPWKDYFGVVMEQGRVHVDADWNEFVAELARRLQATAMDTLGPAEAGRAIVPSTTPSGFEILVAPGDITIGVGRVYVDGLLAENHGAPDVIWDARLAELTGSAAVSFFAQPYLPFNAADEPAPANVFNRPALREGRPLLVYLDVWQRDVTYLQDRDLVEKAVGVDTTARMQLVWQVKVLRRIGDATCGTPDDELPGWLDLIRPSGARLTTATGDVPGDPNPCLVPPAAGYKGLENQLYRVEIHRGGDQDTATFKWSRDNATVATRVSEVQDDTRLVVESLGRDDVLGFHPGEWIEIVDDWHELHGRAGMLKRIRPGDGVDTATRSIVLEDPIPAGLFPVDGQGRTDPTRHTRIRRWDQSDTVRRADGSAFHDVDASASSDGIPLPPAGTALALENGILVDFDLEAGGEYKTGDYWVFAARATDGTIELLDRAPPRGIHHHYARLAVVTLPDVQEDCRVRWPPAGGGESCDCTVCVHAEAHNAGTATIQQAIDFVRARGGTVCLDAGTYRLAAPLNFAGAQSVRLRGQGWRTLLQAAQSGTMVDIENANGVTIENLSLLGAAIGTGPTALINARQCIALTLADLTVLSITTGVAAAAAIGLSRIVFDCDIRDCTLVADQGVVALAGADDYLLAANVRIADCALNCGRRGVQLGGTTLYWGELRLAGNLLLGCTETAITATGAAFPESTVTIAGNVIHVSGVGIRAGTDRMRIADNELGAPPTAPAPADAIVLEQGFDPGPLDRTTISGNRIRGFGGDGIAIRHALGQAMIKSNTMDAIGGAAISMGNDESTGYVCIENNQFLDIGTDFNEADAPYFGVLLSGAARADVVGNVFGNVARQAIQPPLRAAVAVQASDEVRVAANRFFGIGPERFSGRTIAIAAAADFRQLAIDDNAASRIGDAGEQVSAAAWQAIAIGTHPADGAPPDGLVFTPGVFVARVNENVVHVGSFRIRLLPARQGVASVRGNRLRSQSTVAPTIEIDDVIGCLVNENDAQASGAADAAIPVGRVQCRHASVGNNRVIGVGESPTLAIDAQHFAVVGNITSGPIHANGAALPAPWNALNVHA